MSDMFTTLLFSKLQMILNLLEICLHLYATHLQVAVVIKNKKGNVTCCHTKKCNGQLVYYGIKIYYFINIRNYILPLERAKVNVK